MRFLTPRDRSFFEPPHAVGWLLLIANIAAYGLCLARSGAIDIPADILLRAGAMESAAIARHEYWRLVAYGFLHADLIHLAANMSCFILWAGHLEKRIGSLYFLLVYVCALMAAGVVEHLTHPGEYLMVGASGAVSGILGALLCLWILGKTDLPAGFFVIGLGLNVALALGASKIDWSAHFSGFVVGVLFCGLLDLVERANAHALRCKFPEFVKMNGLVAGGVLTIYFFESRPLAFILREEGWLPLFAYLAGCLAVVKLLDFILSMKKGLVVIVVLFAAANAAITLFVADALFPTLASKCPLRLLGSTDRIERLAGTACANLNMTINIVAAGVFALTILAHWRTLRRGIKDVGFVANSLRAERQRHQGI
jgi:membrane associated rhomboid family serine protease